MCIVPKPYPKEFREDVVRVARGREPGTRLVDVASDFGISETCLANWLKAADVEDGLKPETTSAENAELREARRRIRLFEQENEVLRRAAAYLSQANLPGNDLPARPWAGSKPIARTPCSTPTATTPSSVTGSSPARGSSTFARSRTRSRTASLATRPTRE